jgi:hypothetical protein
MTAVVPRRRPDGKLLLRAAQKLNIALLMDGKKDLTVITEVYGRAMAV